MVKSLVDSWVTFTRLGNEKKKKKEHSIKMWRVNSTVPLTTPLCKLKTQIHKSSVYINHKNSSRYKTDILLFAMEKGEINHSGEGFSHTGIGHNRFSRTKCLIDRSLYRGCKKFDKTAAFKKGEGN